MGVQTNATSLWNTVKQWFLEVCSVRGSELSSMAYSKVNKWIHKIDPSTLESDHTIDSVGSQSPLQNLVSPDDSASNVSEVISESKLDNLVHPDDSASNVVARVYDITDRAVLNQIMETSIAYLEYQDNLPYVVADQFLSVDPAIMNCLTVFS